MSEQTEDVNSDVEGDDAEDAYEGDLGDMPKLRGGGSAGIIGLGSGE